MWPLKPGQEVLSQERDGLRSRQPRLPLLPTHNRLLSLAGETRDEEEGGMELMIAR